MLAWLCFVVNFGTTVCIAEKYEIGLLKMENPWKLYLIFVFTLKYVEMVVKIDKM